MKTIIFLNNKGGVGKTVKELIDMKRMIIVLSMVIAFVSCLVMNGQADAKSRIPKLNRKSVELETGDKVKVSIKNITPKKVKWSVNKAGKKCVILSNKAKKGVTIKGKKTGIATVTAKVTYQKKTKKLKVKIKVSKTKKKENNPVTVIMKKQTDFPGKVKASIDSSGYVKLQWDKVTDAHAYVVQRKTETDNWAELKVTASRNYTDRTVIENATYFYRVRANCTGMCTKYSEAVTIKTGKIKSVSNTPEPTQVPTVTLEPTQVPTATPEPTPYQPKYSYEVEVLNKFTIYENVPIALFVKTDNPNPNCTSEELGSVYTSFGGDYTGGQLCTFEDVRYLEPEEVNSTFFDKVNGGWVSSLWFSASGVKNVTIKERGHIVDTFQIEVQDGQKALQNRCNEIIKEVSNDNYESEYPDDKTVGKKWDELQGEEKLERLECYVREHLHYPRLGPLTSFGYKTIWFVQENVGAYWETGFADCGASNDMMCVLARTLGYQAELRNTTMNGGLHIQAVVTIDGVEHIFDATPWQGGYKDWDYIL